MGAGEQAYLDVRGEGADQSCITLYSACMAWFNDRSWATMDIAEQCSRLLVCNYIYVCRLATNNGTIKI